MRADAVKVYLVSFFHILNEQGYTSMEQMYFFIVKMWPLCCQSLQQQRSQMKNMIKQRKTNCRAAVGTTGFCLVRTSCDELCNKSCS